MKRKAGPLNVRESKPNKYKEIQKQIPSQTFVHASGKKSPIYYPGSSPNKIKKKRNIPFLILDLPFSLNIRRKSPNKQAGFPFSAF